MCAKVYSYTDLDTLTKSFGKYILTLQDQAIEKRGNFKIAVSGGSLGKALKKALIDNEEVSGDIKWEKWSVFFSDERLVPISHPDSNAGLFIETVVNHLPEGSSKPQLNIIDESLLTGKDGQTSDYDASKDEQIAAAYEKLLPADVKIDLILLGCGPDGHTCSLFPGHRLLEEREKLISYIDDSPKPPPRRITFTFPVLENSPNIAFIADGEGKAPTLRQIFSQTPSDLPSALVNRLSPGSHVAWFVTEGALTGVNVPTSKY